MPVLAIVGPTGTGKSALSLAVAHRLAAAGVEAEVVNADAMQLYRGMDIGTAKLAPEERGGVPHHLLDVLDVTEESTAADYQRRARDAIDEIAGRGRLPVLVGGSGLYVSAVLYEFSFPGTDPALRARLEAEAARAGVGPLLERLAARDPEAAATVDARNPRRVVRALEVAELAGPTGARGLPERPVPWRPARVVGLRVPREELVRRLDARVAAMWEAGLLEEVAGLLERGLADGPTAGRAIGYAQAAAQLRGELEEPEAIERTRALTRRYARRQVSWFSRDPALEWADPAQEGLADRVAAEVLDAVGRAGGPAAHH